MLCSQEVYRGPEKHQFWSEAVSFAYERERIKSAKFYEWCWKLCFMTLYKMLLGVSV